MNVRKTLAGQPLGVVSVRAHVSHFDGPEAGPGSSTAYHPLLPVQLCERLLSAGMERGADFAEVYVERNEFTAVTLEEDKVKSAQNGLSQGVGVRVISGAKVGYAYSDDLDEEALFRAARTAAFIAHGGGSERAFHVTRTPLPTFYRLGDHLADVEVALKRDLVVRANKAARAYDKRIKQVMCSWADSHQAGAGRQHPGPAGRRHAGSLPPLHHGGGRRARKASGAPARTAAAAGCPSSTSTPSPPSWWRAKRPGRRSRAWARPTPKRASRRWCWRPGWSGILLHEAVGHGLEADFIRKGTSLFTGKLGQKVASDLVTVIDDGTMANARGSLNVDDEGNPAQFKVLIERGELKGYMYDSLNAKLMNQQSTGQRAARVVQAPAHAAHDQHLPGAR